MAIYHGSIALTVADVLNADFEVVLTTVLLTLISIHGYGCIDKQNNPISRIHYVCIRDTAVY